MEITDDLNVHIDCEPGRKLGDHHLILADLDATLACCDRLVQIRHTAGSDRTLEDCLWTTALVKYSRCFGSGKRLRLSLDTLGTLDSTLRQHHWFFLNLRDKHVAHSVNDFEQARVGVSLIHPESGKDPGIIAHTSVSVSHLLTTDDSHVLRLRMLAATVREAVVAQVKALTEEFQRYVSTLTLEQLYAMPEMREARHAVDRVGVRRRL